MIAFNEICDYLLDRLIYWLSENKEMRMQFKRNWGSYTYIYYANIGFCN